MRSKADPERVRLTAPTPRLRSPKQADDPLARLEWQQRAASVGAYRELSGYSEPADGHHDRSSSANSLAEDTALR